jgi:copper chaperone
MKNLIVLLLLAVTLLIGFVAITCSPNEYPQAEQANNQIIEAKTVSLEIKGMTCGGCVNSINKAVANCEGINDYDVDLKQGLAVVSFDPALTNETEIAQSISDLGYEVTLKN